MFCTNCGAEVPEENQFCTNCGNPMGGAKAHGKSEATSDEYAQPKSFGKVTKHKSIQIGAIITALVIFACISVAIVLLQNSAGFTGETDSLREEQASEYDEEAEDDTEPEDDLAEDYGAEDVGGISDPKDSVETMVSSDDVRADQSLIMGVSHTTIEQMVRRYSEAGHEYPSDVFSQYGASSIEQFCQILFEEAAAEGVRAEVVFAQSMMMTGWLQFGGIVFAEQCNFAGLGTGNGEYTAEFNMYGPESVRIGIRAQVQHLKAYASTDSLVKECVDPLFSSVERGSAQTVFDLSGRWAPDNDLGIKIANGVESLLAA